MGSKPSSTSGRVSMEMLSGGALSKMKLRNVSDQPLAPIRHVEIEAGQARQRHLALLIAHREVIPAAVVEVADPGDADAVAVDNHPRHHRDFRSPLAIVRGTDGDPPHDHAEKQRDRNHARRR